MVIPSKKILTKIRTYQKLTVYLLPDKVNFSPEFHHHLQYSLFQNKGSMN